MFDAGPGDGKAIVQWRHYPESHRYSIKWGVADTTVSGDAYYRNVQANTVRISNDQLANVCVDGYCSTEVTGLTNGSAHVFRVVAVRQNFGTIGETDLLAATPLAGVPGQPSVTVTGGDQQVTATWTADDNGNTITGYDVQYRATWERSWTDAAHSGATASATISGLRHNSKHWVRVRATNSGGTGAWSVQTAATTDAGPPEAPWVTLTVRDEQITAAWEYPIDNGHHHGLYRAAQAVHRLQLDGPQRHRHGPVPGHHRADQRHRVRHPGQRDQQRGNQRLVAGEVGNAGRRNAS